MAFNIFQKFSGSKGGAQRAPRTSAKNRASSDRKDAAPVENEAVEAVALTNDVVVKGSKGMLLIPHISEKATMAAEGNEKHGPAYVFRVPGSVNKLAIKAAVEDRYKVKVEDVRVINLPGKVRRRGRVTGHQAGYKKAVVALQTGFAIDEF